MAVKVALCIRADWKEHPGGDVVQLQKTKEALEAAFPVVATIVGAPDDPALLEADIVHVFNVQQPEVGLPFLRAAKAAGKKTVLSTIFWDLSHAHLAMVRARLGKGMDPAVRSVKGLYEFGFRLLGKPAYFTAHSRAQVREMVELSDLCLPNSVEEMAHVEKYTGLQDRHFGVVVNAVDPSIFYPGSDPRAGIIQVGGFEAVKNHLGVLAALMGSAEPLTFVGRASNPAYYEKVSADAQKRGNVTLQAPLPAEEVASLLRRAKVHVNPSFRESPGLSTMEALACGCNVVIAEAAYCPVETYFGDLIGSSVFLSDPYDPRSIRSAIETALSSPTHDLSEWVARFSWKEAARQTYEGYQTIP